MVTVILMLGIVIVAVILVVVLSRSTATAFSPIANQIITERDEPVKSASAEFGIPARRIYAMIMTESRNDQNALGSAGERGLMQIKESALIDFNRRFPNRKTWLGFPVGFDFDDLFDPTINIMVGTGYLKIQNDVLGNLDDATQAYNAGLSAFVADRRKGLNYLMTVKANERFFP